MGRRGLTLSEIIVALGLLAVASLVLLGLFSRMLASQSKSSHQTVGILMAQKIIERCSRAGPPNWGLTDITQVQTESVVVQESKASVDFSYQLTASVVAPEPSKVPMGTLYLLELKLWWWSEQAVGGTGKSFVETSRVVYIEK